jgi:hypothetical protein
MAQSQFFETGRDRSPAPRVPRLPEPHPDHHLWRNGRLWWVAFTVHLPPWHKERVRLSLGTADVREARRLRDELLKRYPQVRECELSLRIVAPRSRRRDQRPLAA